MDIYKLTQARFIADYELDELWETVKILLPDGKTVEKQVITLTDFESETQGADVIPIEWIKREIDKYKRIDTKELGYAGKKGVEVLSKLLNDWDIEYSDF